MVLSIRGGLGWW